MQAELVNSQMLIDQGNLLSSDNNYLKSKLKQADDQIKLHERSFKMQSDFKD